MHFNHFPSASAAALIAVPLAATSFASGLVPDRESKTVRHAVEMVEVTAGTFDYPMPGEFLANGRPSYAPVMEQAVRRAFNIMKYQVSQADYQRCVEAGACRLADTVISTNAELTPITGVNYLDAQAYAVWYSQTTGENWRLPTDAEWAYLAGERYTGENYSTVASDPDNPAVAWIRQYEEEAAARRPPDPTAHPHGHFGPNTVGVYDLAGNIWEWTSTCYLRTTLDAKTGEIVHKTENCRVHIAEGRHRAYLSDFIRDGVSGGCSVGTPPDNLGFRLVRDGRRWFLLRVLDYWRGAIARPVRDH